jgi:uncharacterized protein
MTVMGVSNSKDCTAGAAQSHAQTWIVTDGSIGMERQGEAVAEAVGLPFAHKRVHAEGLAGLLPTRLQAYLPPAFLLRSLRSDASLTPPWPRLVITIGRRSAPVGVAIKRSSHGASYALHIQDPKLPPRLFDMVAAPLHDNLKAANVITTFGAPHSVTRERLDQAMPDFAAAVETMPQPRIAVLIGGNSGGFRLTPEIARRLGQDLADFARKHSASLLITPSRRTGHAAIAAIASQVTGQPHLIWDGTGDNPYHAFLGFADAIVVTGESVNMVTEAAGTGKPVYVYRLPGRSRRLSHFHRMLAAHGATRDFDASLESWTYSPVNDTELIAAPIRKALGLETFGGHP